MAIEYNTGWLPSQDGTQLEKLDSRMTPEAEQLARSYGVNAESLFWEVVPAVIEEAEAVLKVKPLSPEHPVLSMAFEISPERSDGFVMSFGATVQFTKRWDGRHPALEAILEVVTPEQKAEVEAILNHSKGSLKLQ